MHNSYYDFEMDLSKNEISKIMNPEGENTQQDEKEIYKEFFDSQENSKDMFDKSIKFSKVLTALFHPLGGQKYVCFKSQVQ